MRKSNYDKRPATLIPGNLWKGWETICSHIQEVCASKGAERHVLVVECYQE